MRIVVVEPDAMMGKVLHLVLTEAGHDDVVLVRSAAEAMAEVVGQETDVVLLEVDLPDMDGVDLCKELRARRYNGPLIFVTQHWESHYKLRAFEHGADDFIVEPFDPAELIARVDAVVRRCKQADYQALGTVLKVGDAELSIGELVFQIEGQEPVRLTPTEMRMLECLMRNSHITITRDTLIERTWGYDFFGETKRVDVYIRRLREKIERDPGKPEYVHTVRGVGYMFRAPTEADVLRLAPTGHDFEARPGSTFRIARAG